MADTSYFTLPQLFQVPYVTDVISQYPTPDTAFQRFYRSMTNRTFTPVRTFVWDQFNKTRTIATLTAPMTDANVIHRQKIGHCTGALLRMAEKMRFLDEEFKNFRPLGGQIGQLNADGAEWATRQIKFMHQRHSNLMEYALAKTLTGGFGLARSQTAYRVTELNAAGNEYDIDMHIPSSHKGQLALDTGNANIIDTSWASPAADIISQMFKLRQVAIRETGYEPKNCWISSKIAGYLFSNIGLQSVAGLSNRVWNTVTDQPAQVDPSNRNLGGLRITFNAIPWITFYVNDVVVNVGSATDPQGADSTAAADCTRLLPEDYAIFTPDADNEWLTFFGGEEPVQEQIGGQSTQARNFHTFTRRLTTPLAPGYEAYMVDNFLPAIRIPNAVYFPKVVFSP